MSSILSSAANDEHKLSKYFGLSRPQKSIWARQSDQEQKDIISPTKEWGSPKIRCFSGRRRRRVNHGKIQKRDSEFYAKVCKNTTILQVDKSFRRRELAMNCKFPKPLTFQLLSAMTLMGHNFVYFPPILGVIKEASECRRRRPEEFG